MSLNAQFNMGARIKSKTALANTAITQSSAALATTQDGITVDRNASGFRRYYSCKAVVSGAFTGSSSQVVASLIVNVQHSSDGTSWDNYTTGTATVFGSSSTAGSTGTTGGAAYGTVETSSNLNGARRYVRIQIPAPTFADCSSGSALAVHGVLVFGGADELPAQ